MVAINPATIYGWLLVNDKELAAKTGLAPTPKGSAGSFAEGAAIGFSMFKKAKLVEKSPSALEFFMQPDKIQAISKSVEGRFVPIYVDHTKTDFWNGSAFAAMKEIAQSGRVRNWPAPGQPWLSDVTDAKYTLSDMIQKIVNDNMKIEDAQAWAQKEMEDSYNKFVKK
jgi:ABC-type glycerol-3-phosphate transport system substrate-binding protein